MGSVSPLPVAPPDVPPFVEHWIRQLLDPENLDLFRRVGERRVDIRLSASSGRVCRRVVVSIDAGQQEFVEL